MGFNSKSADDYNKNKEYFIDLHGKIDSIKKSPSKPYFNKTLKDLIDTNPNNASIIYDYIIAWQTELNIKD